MRARHNIRKQFSTISTHFVAAESVKVMMMISLLKIAPLNRKNAQGTRACKQSENLFKECDSKVAFTQRQITRRKMVVLS